MYFDFANLPVRDRYKLAVSTIVPRPIAWMVTQDLEGRVNAAPYSFFNVFSDTPVVVGIGVGARPEGSLKDTAANVRSSGQFGL
jgi:flavin reductase (DIM6/NTAB) family NADH-FMN oxidoreductase RutF